MELRQCRVCGGVLETVGAGRYKCKNCGNVYESEYATTEQAANLAAAWLDLRCGSFFDAEEKFDAILQTDPACGDAYYGKLLCKYGINFTDDPISKRKVPTCHNPEIESVTADPLYLKAVNLAKDSEKQSIISQCAAIEKIRQEWVEKAQNEKPYDVFICYKDSDLEHGIRQTPDSVEATKLYTYLTVDCNLRVFFARQSLREHTSEVYEPYIFAALKTAKVMIVYGQKREYMEAVWVRNEWQRWMQQIARGEKAKDSLVVAYEHMPFSDLPSRFAKLQCLDASEKTFLGDLTDHIRKVIDRESKVELAQVGVKTGKKTRIFAEKRGVTLQEIKASDEVETRALNTEKRLQIINMNLSLASRRKKAIADLEQLRYELPDDGRVLSFDLVIKQGLSSIDDFRKPENMNKVADVSVFEKIISNSDKRFALTWLNILYDYVTASLATENDLTQAVKVFAIVLKYQSDARQDFIFRVKESCIARCVYRLFDIAIDNLGLTTEETVNEYIRFIDRCLEIGAYDKALEYCDKVLKEYDEGNTTVRCMRLAAKYKSRNFETLMTMNCTAFEDFDELKNTLEYCKDKKEMLSLLDTVNNYVLAGLSSSVKADAFRRFYDRFIAFYPKDKQKAKISELVGRAQSVRAFDIAMYYCKFLIDGTSADANVYWCMMMCSIGCATESELYKITEDIDANPYYKKAYEAADSDTTAKIISITQTQLRTAEANRQKEASENQKKTLGKKIETLRKTSKIVAIVLKWLSLFLAVMNAMAAWNSTFVLCMPWKALAYELFGSRFGAILFVFVFFALFGICSGLKNKAKRVKDKKVFRTFAKVVVVAIIIAGSSFGALSATFSKGAEMSGKVIRSGDTLISLVECDGGYRIREVTSSSDTDKIVIPDSYNNIDIVEIGKDAFKEAKGDELVVMLGKNIKIIGESAFEGNEDITYIYCTEGCTLEEIGQSAFENCNNLSRVALPGTVEKIGKKAFFGCSDLNYVSFEECSDWYVERGNGYYIKVQVTSYPENNAVLIKNNSQYAFVKR